MSGSGRRNQAARTQAYVDPAQLPVIPWSIGVFPLLRWGGRSGRTHHREERS